MADDRLQELLRRLRTDYDGFNEPALDSDLARMQHLVGKLPADYLTIYRDHDGASNWPSRADGSFLPARLMPVEEVLESQPAIDEALGENPIGDVAWLWTDDNSNYAGVYTSGILRGFMVKLDHEEPMLSPAWRSLSGFLRCLLNSAPGVADVDDEAVDVVMIPSEIPAIQEHVHSDQELVSTLTRMALDEKDDDRRRLLAVSAINLTPFNSNSSVFPFLEDEDLIIPEAAIDLLELRNYRGPVDHIERLAQHGHANGDTAAMRLLIRMKTPESEAAIARLKDSLTGQKRSLLEQILQLHERHGWH